METPASLLLLLAFEMQDSSACKAPAAEDVVGIWQMSFHPRHEDLLERDHGYLVILPDRTYWRWDNDYLSQPSTDTASREHGGWSLTPTGLRLRPGDARPVEGEAIELSRLPGRSYEWCFSPSVLISLGDKSILRELPVLRHLREPDDLNYSFAKIY